MQRVQLTFTGRVQGVGFRATAVYIARSHPVTGWVRNEPDGTVLAEVQGEAPAINAFLSALRTRMERFITRVDTVPATPVEGDDGFHIR
ncbi:MAG: acylphosphatase [Planctomycetota bacterium]